MAAKPASDYAHGKLVVVGDAVNLQAERSYTTPWEAYAGQACITEYKDGWRGGNRTSQLSSSRVTRKYMHLYRPDPAFRHLLFLFISVAVSAIASAQSVSEKAAKDELIYMSSEEPAMRKAFARAAETLPEFLSLAAKPKVGTSSYALKVAISDGRNTEYFWVNNFSNEGDLFAGTLSNQPRLVKKHQLGDRIAFRRVQIVDWTYFDESSRKTIGNFTACALISKEPPEQAAAVLRQYGLSCDN